jgi:hypothetical protein
MDEASKYLLTKIVIAPSSHYRPLLLRSSIENVIRDTRSTDLCKEILFPLELESTDLVYGVALKNVLLSLNPLRVWRNSVEFHEWEVQLYRDNDEECVC